MADSVRKPRPQARGVPDRCVRRNPLRWSQAALTKVARAPTNSSAAVIGAVKRASIAHLPNRRLIDCLVFFDRASFARSIVALRILWTGFRSRLRARFAAAMASRRSALAWL